MGITTNLHKISTNAQMVFIILFFSCDQDSAPLHYRTLLPHNTGCLIFYWSDLYMCPHYTRHNPPPWHFSYPRTHHSEERSIIGGQDIKWHHLIPIDITPTLKTHVRRFGSTIYFLPKDVFAWFLRAAGDIALLCAGINHNRMILLVNGVAMKCCATSTCRPHRSCSATPTPWSPLGIFY